MSSPGCFQPVTKGHAAAAQPLPNWQTGSKEGRRGRCLAPQKVPPALSRAWTMGSWACPTLQTPTTLYTPASASSPAMATTLGTAGPSVPIPPARMVGRRPQDPVFPAPHHFQPLTHLLGNYLYPSHKCSAQRSRQASLFCWQPQDMRRGLGPEQMCGFMSLTRCGGRG